jgi:hypothetical protein
MLKENAEFMDSRRRYVLQIRGIRVVSYSQNDGELGDGQSSRGIDHYAKTFCGQKCHSELGDASPLDETWVQRMGTRQIIKPRNTIHNIHHRLVVTPTHIR